MSNITCAKCGEQWDSTHGLHASHSDLSPGQYEQLINGYCCPACVPGAEPDLEGWRASIDHISENMTWFVEDEEMPGHHFNVDEGGSVQMIDD